MRPIASLPAALLLALCSLAGAARAQQPPEAEPARAPSGFENLSLWGYGELYYAHPVHDPDRSQADLRRAVFGIGYRFSPRVTFNSEFEVEHAVASASDPGEFEVEQFYVDFQATDWLTVTAGMFLMPFGTLNEHHEPTNFFGVQRNFVETLIIPSTWREGGIALRGRHESGLGWSAGVTTGVDLSKWSFAPEFPQYLTALDLEARGTAPLQAVHQEMALANASHLAGYLAVDYHGVPGLLVGAAATTGIAAPVPAPVGAPSPGDSRVSLWEAHVRWTPGKLDLSALYAGGAISNTAAANAANPGSPTPIPAAFRGWYAQAAYSVWQDNTFRLAPFARLESYDLGTRYEGTSGPQVPGGVVPVSATPGDTGTWPVGHDRVLTVGANLWVTPQVVVKADYQWFDANTDFSRLDLGLGLAF